MVATSSRVRADSWAPRSGGPAELRRLLLGFERGRSGRVPTSPHGLGVLALNPFLPTSKSALPVLPHCQDGSRQAQSNLTFLSILKEPYQELAYMRPRDICSKLPKLINLIRIIWVNSPHYNTRERLTSLFRKVCVCRAGGAGGTSGLAEDPGVHAVSSRPQ